MVLAFRSVLRDLNIIFGILKALAGFSLNQSYSVSFLLASLSLVPSRMRRLKKLGASVKEGKLFHDGFYFQVIEVTP